MLTCAEFSDRLYDEDCRRALSGALAPPADIALHLAAGDGGAAGAAGAAEDGCAACRLLWAEAADDLARLPALLLEPPPAHLHAALLRPRGGPTASQAAPATSRWAIDWTAGLTWAALGATLALMAASHLQELAGRVAPHLMPAGSSVPVAPLVLLGASLAFAASTARQSLGEVAG